MRQRCHFGAGRERVEGLGLGGRKVERRDTRFERKARFRQNASLMSTGPVYLDCNATTPMEPAVGVIVRRFFEEEFGNEGSRTHAFGARAKEAVHKAREQIAALLEAKPEEVIFTSGATESNNLAILGLAHWGRSHGKTENRQIVAQIGRAHV